MTFTNEEKYLMQEACLQALEKLKKEPIFENNVEEYGGSEILYHFTSLQGLLSILLNNGKHGGYFQYGLPDGEEDKLINSKMAGGNKDPYTHYMSLTRSANVNWGYAKAVNDTSFGKKDKEGKENTHTSTLKKIPLSRIGTVRITFDGKELTKGRVIKAIDYYGAGNDPKSSNGRTVKTRSGKWAGEKNQNLRYSQVKQQEDRLFANSYDFQGVLNYVIRIDILVSDSSAGRNWANKILTAAIDTPVQNKIHVYSDIKYYNRISASRIPNSLAQRGMDEKTWRKEITDEIPRDYKFKPNDIITDSNAKLIAVFCWAILFYEKFAFLVNESKKFDWSLASNFTNEDVLWCLNKFLKKIGFDDKDMVRRIVTDKVLTQFRKIKNSELIDFLTGSKNFKLSSATGVARTVLGPMQEEVMRIFNVRSLKDALHRIGKEFARIYKGYAELVDSQSKLTKKRKEYADRHSAKTATTTTPAKRGRKPRATTATTAPSTGKRGRKANDFVNPIPSLSLKGLGTIFNVKSIADAAAKIKELCKNDPEFAKVWNNAKQKIYRTARQYSGLLNEWVDRIETNGQNNGWCIIVVGGPGSGKSYFINNMLPIKGEVFDIDNYRQRYLDYLKDSGAESYNRLSKRSGFKELTVGAVDFIKKAEIDFLKTHSSNNSNIIFDIVGRKESDILDIIKLVKPFGYNIGICWTVCNRSVAIKRNIDRGASKENGRNIIPDKPFHKRTNGANKLIPSFLQGPSSSDVDAAWIVLTSSNSLAPMTDDEKSKCVLELEKSNGGFKISSEDLEKINGILGPAEKSNNFTPETYLSNAEIKKLQGDRKNFLREQTNIVAISEDDIKQMVYECLSKLF